MSVFSSSVRAAAPTTNREKFNTLKDLPYDARVNLKENTSGKISISKKLVLEKNSRDSIEAIINGLFKVKEIIEQSSYISYTVTLKKDTEATVYQNAESSIEAASFIRFSIDRFKDIIGAEEPVTFNVMYSDLLAHFPEQRGGKRSRKTRHRKRKSQRKSRRRHH